jgi:hypothetical protein
VNGVEITADQLNEKEQALFILDLPPEGAATSPFIVAGTQRQGEEQREEAIPMPSLEVDAVGKPKWD